MMRAHILVVGSDGYLGSHMVQRIAAKGHVPLAMPRLAPIALTVPGRLDTFLEAQQIDAVMHFPTIDEAGRVETHPAPYYLANVAGTIALLDGLRRHGIGKVVFSSTAAIFGEPRYLPVDERHLKDPIHPCGRAAWMVEQVLADFALAYGMHSSSLRCFNVAGADLAWGGRTGGGADPHLIPQLLEVAAGQRSGLTVFGENYVTPDGSAIRDYVHVADLCDAHLLALEDLLDGAPGAAYNIGNGVGYSTLEVIAAVEKVTGHSIARLRGSRCAGGPPVLLANASLARRELHWRPKFPDIHTMIEDAWRAQQALPHDAAV